MSLSRLTIDGHLSWFCHADVCEYECEHAFIPHEAHFSQVEPRRIDTSHYRGMVIALPQCPCSSQMFLKADYTRKELMKENVLRPLKDDAGNVRGMFMTLPHVRNLRLHHLIAKAGMIGNTPVLPDLPDALQSWHEHIDIDMLCSYWFTYVLTQRDKSVDGFLAYLSTFVVIEQKSAPRSERRARKRTPVTSN